MSSISTPTGRHRCASHGSKQAGWQGCAWCHHQGKAVLVTDALTLQECPGSGNRLRQMLAGDHGTIGRQDRWGLRAGCWGLQPPAGLQTNLDHGY
jgi:hypothetical protein